jgi:hypothetical protein
MRQIRCETDTFIDTSREKPTDQLRTDIHGGAGLVYARWRKHCLSAPY